jgi:hypothetical protein
MVFEGGKSQSADFVTTHIFLHPTIRVVNPLRVTKSHVPKPTKNFPIEKYTKIHSHQNG